ncbi:Putative nicotinamide N-methyltransferase, partial [Leucoagaricus sp. SymC.cos]
WIMYRRNARHSFVSLPDTTKSCENRTILKLGAGGALPSIFYSHGRPHLTHRDIEFFKKARSRSWTTDEIIMETFPPMFPNDPRDEAVRATVHGWKLTKS